MSALMKYRTTELVISARGVVFDPATGDSFSMEGPAARLLRMLANGASEEDLAAGLVADHAISEITARRDAGHFLAMLQRLGLLAEVEV